ncbi:hypothetical protein HanHA300_Chr16g0627821 [Helianthus annuus]|nr:hypothetical protein HanHA300_Chr16g0627821 [Helianthus annuus]KAJ0462053.1 hypothetical protein HanHA89_Chr16g0679121 [Helianthus annuus]KAJ0642448.1 hypothetical protein HanLR1_Chr16g0638351 [Helianthus annuus]
MASIVCFLHPHQPLSTPIRIISPRQLSMKPHPLVVCQAATHEPVSRRLALTVLIGAAAVGTKVSPADAAYGQPGTYPSP